MRNLNAQDVTKLLLEGNVFEDRHMVNIPVDPYEKEDSFAYYNDDGGVSFNIPSNIETFVKKQEHLDFYYECVNSNKYSEDQLDAIQELLTYKEWKWLNKVTMEDIKRICNPEYSAKYIKSFGQIMHSNRRITSDIFFNNTDPNSECEFVCADPYIGLNFALCYLNIVGASNEDINNIRNIYKKVKESNTDSNIKILNKLQYKICHLGNNNLTDIINQYNTQLDI